MRWALAVMLVGACRGSNVTPDTAPLPTPAADLPAWFGQEGTREIAGTLLDEDGRLLAGTVHLRLDVPDPTIWVGLDREVGADGRFLFTAPRAGRYTLYATAPGRISRVVDVDARTADADVAVFVFPCREQPILVQTQNGGAIATARVDVGGTSVYADTRGRLSVCVSGRPLDAVVRAPGFAAWKTTIFGSDTPREIVLLRAIAIRGQIFDEAGRPATNVGVQPRLVDQTLRPHYYPDLDLPLVVASGVDGRFVFHELAETDPHTRELAAYTARSMRDGDDYDHGDAWIGVHAEGELVLRREPIAPRDLEMSGLPVTWKLRGRVARDGVPVPDAAIVRHEIQMSRKVLGYSRADGTFDLDVADWSNKQRNSARLEVLGPLGQTRTFDDVRGTDVVLELR